MSTTDTPAFAFWGPDDPHEPDLPGPDDVEPRVPVHARRTLVLAGAMIGLSFLPAPWSVAALPLALVVPGYAVCAALVGPQRPRGIAARFVVWMAVSVAALIVSGVVAGAIGFQLDRTRVMLGQAGLALLAAAITVVRRTTTDDPTPAADTNAATTAEAGLDLTEQPDDPRQVRIAVAFLVATIVVAAIGIALVQRTDDGTARITYVSMGFDGVIDDAPLKVGPDGTVSVTVAVDNHDLAPRTLSVVAGVDGGTTWTGSEARPVGPGARATIHLSGPVPASGCFQRVSIALMDGDRSVTRLSRWVAGDPTLACAAPATTG